MTLSMILPPLVLLLGCAAFIFWPQAYTAPVVEKTRADYLRERKDVIFDNLRDLNFEFRAGKYPEEDYQRQRDSLETEAAEVMREMESLEPSTELSKI